MSGIKSHRSNQDHFVQAIFGLSDHKDFEPQGFSIYRRNLEAAAARSIAISYPTIARLLGVDRLTRFSHDYLSSHGRSVFDWGEWGDTFPTWLSRHPMSEEHPYLADCARLDWCVHLSERARDPQPDIASFALLDQMDTFDFTFAFSTGVFLLTSNYPVVEIFNAHKINPEDPDLSTAIALLKSGKGQTALVWRQGLYTKVREVKPDEKAWLALFDDPGLTVGNIMNQVREDLQPLEQWLNQAIHAQLVIGLRQSSPSLSSL